MTDQTRIEQARARLMETLRLLDGVEFDDVGQPFTEVARAVRGLDAVIDRPLAISGRYEAHVELPLSLGKSRLMREWAVANGLHYTDLLVSELSIDDIRP